MIIMKERKDTTQITRINKIQLSKKMKETQMKVLKSKLYW